jgi:hypothetical protein
LSLRRLGAAIARDILDLSPEKITDWLGYENRGEAKKLARKGRELWRQLGAWPWSCHASGRLPDEWWLQDRTVEMLVRWSYGYIGCNVNGPQARRIKTALVREATRRGQALSA